MLDSTRIGDWYGALAGRAGWGAERALFYAKAGIGFADVRSSVTDTCAAGPCTPALLNASGNGGRAFGIYGGGIEWAWHDKWTLKAEYLFFDVSRTVTACGAGGGSAAGSTFCASHALDGVHTGKVGLNYKLY